MENIILKTPLSIYFNFFPKVFFPKFELPNSGCSLSASAAYTPVFTVLIIQFLSEKILVLSRRNWRNVSGKGCKLKILDGVRNSQGASFNSIRLDLIIQVVMGCKDNVLV